MRSVKLTIVGSVLFLAGCQTATYTQYMAGPPLEYAQAKCNMIAPSTNTGYFAMGSAGYVAGAALGNAIGNAIREEEFKKNCMAVQGWRQDAPGAKKLSAPAPVRQMPRPQGVRKMPIVQQPAIRQGVVAAS